METVEITEKEVVEKALPVPRTSRVVTLLQDFWDKLKHNPKMFAGMCIIVFFLLIAIFGPMLSTTDPHAFSPDKLEAPSAKHWLGTTQTGEDVFAQLMVGTRYSIMWGLLAGLAVTVLSITIGLSAGYFGGVIDEVLSMITNVFLVTPALPLAIMIAAFIVFRGSLTVTLVIIITSWAWGARVLRAQTMTLRTREFVEAARCSGESTWRIIFIEILPNEIAIVASGFIGTMLYVILASAGLEFLGLGNATAVSWGTMFFWAQNNDALLLGAWWWFVAPGMCIALLGSGLALVNFGIDEIANPKLRSERGLRKYMKLFTR